MANREYKAIEGIDYLDLSEWKFEELLASSNNSVYSYSNIKDENKRIAVKEILYKEEDEEELVDNLYKIQHIKQFKHENIIEIYGITQVIKKKVHGESYSVMIGMEQADMNLEDEIRLFKKQNRCYDRSQILYFLQDILHTLAFLQKRMIVHRDIKPENIFKKGNRYVLGDLDDIKIRGNKTIDKSIVFGTFAYSAPELIKALQKGQSVLAYNAYKSDLYSFGLVLLYMCRLKKLNNQDRMKMSSKEINQYIEVECKEVKKKYGKDISDIIKACLVHKPFLRSDIFELYKKLVQRGLLSDDLRKVSPSFFREVYAGMQGGGNSQIDNQTDSSQDYYQVSQTQSYYTENMQSLIDYSPQSDNLDKTQNFSRTNTYTSTIKEGNGKILFNINSSKAKPAVQSGNVSNNGKQQILFNPNKSVIPEGKLKYRQTFNQSQYSGIKGGTNNNYSNFDPSLMDEEDFMNSSYSQYNYQTQQQSQNTSINKGDKSNIRNTFTKLSYSALRCKQEYEEQIQNMENEEVQEKHRFTKKQKIGISIIIFIIILFLVLGIVFIFRYNSKGICKKGKFELDNQCLVRCDMGYFGNDYTQQCEKCVDHCTHCQGSINCEFCEEKRQYVDIKSQCIQSNPDEQIQNTGKTQKQQSLQRQQNNIQQLQKLKYNQDNNIIPDNDNNFQYKFSNNNIGDNLTIE